MVKNLKLSQKATLTSTKPLFRPSKRQGKDEESEEEELTLKQRRKKRKHKILYKQIKKIQRFFLL